MKNDILQSSVKYTAAEFQSAKKQLDQKNDLLVHRQNSYSSTVGQLQYAAETIDEGVANIRLFQQTCDALILSMDATCRPILEGNPDVESVGEVARLIDEIVYEMDTTYTNFEVYVNGSSLGSVGKTKAEAGTKVRSIQMYWQQYYRRMPGYQADLRRLADEQQKKKKDETADLERYVLRELEAFEWLTVQQIRENLFEEYTAQKISAALRGLLARGEVIREELDGRAIFAPAGTPLPSKETAGKQDSIEKEAEETIPAAPQNTEEEAMPKEKKKLSKGKTIFITILMLIVVAVGAVFLVYYLEQVKYDRELEHQNMLVQSAAEYAIAAVEEGKLQKIEFDEETKAALKASGFALSNIFSSTEVREAVSNKFAELYRNMDVDGLLELLAFTDANYIFLLAEDEVYDICFSDEYRSALHLFIRENGTQTESGDEIYEYKDAEFWLTSPDFIGIDYVYVLNGEEKSDSVLLSGIRYRGERHEEYDEHSPGYFIIGENVELVEDVYENSADRANKYYPPATCPECGNSFRENTMRAQKIAEDGYCGMGLCEKD